MGSQPSSPIKLPGFNLPLNWQPKETELFPNALDYGDINDGYVG
ncbi:similar to An03g00240 [Aspergillus luchuensis]|nr:similar to An03g00240 [Aspergillus luchuensis]